MNKYKVTKSLVGYREKYPCVTCGSKINGKKVIAAYYVENMDKYWEDPDKWTNIACSDECANMFILSKI